MSGREAGAVGQEAPAPLPPVARRLVAAGLLLSAFLSALEATVVATAMPTVVGELGGLGVYAWVFTAYLLASTVTVPLYGKLADVHGRKPLMLLGLTLFIAGSLACGLAQDMGQLVAFRVVQGLGAGAVQPIALTMTGDLYPLRERGRIQAALSAVWGMSAIVGPLLGALITEAFSWRWVFALNVPLGLLCLALIAAFFRERLQRRARPPLDLLGAGLLCATVLLLLGVAQGLVPALPALVGAGVSTTLLVRTERRATDPVVPLGLLGQPLQAITAGAGALLGGAMFATVSFVPLFVQAVMGRSATEAGSLLTPLLVGWPIASTLTGHLVHRVPFRRLVRLGLVLAAGSTAGVAWLFGQGSLWGPRAAMLGFGLGLGFANTAMLLAVQTGVTWNQRGVATAFTLFARTMGGTLATGALGGILAGAIARTPGASPRATEALLGPGHGQGLPREILAGLTDALREGLMLNLWLICAMAVAALLAGLAFPRVDTQGAPSRPA